MVVDFRESSRNPGGRVDLGQGWGVGCTLVIGGGGTLVRYTPAWRFTSGGPNFIGELRSKEKPGFLHLRIQFIQPCSRASLTMKINDDNNNVRNFPLFTQNSNLFQNFPNSPLIGPSPMFGYFPSFLVQ